MLRSNLATRPFYNERAVHAVIGVAGALVLAITAFNVLRIVTLSRHNTELSSRISASHAEAERLTADAARIRRSIDNAELAQVVGAAQEANSLIDQRTFSWTEFFNRIESTLPPDVMLASVRPAIKSGTTHVSTVVLSKRAEDVDEFMEKLEATGAFEDVVPATQERTEAGLLRIVVESIYVGAADEPAAADATTPAAKSPADAASPAADPAPADASADAPAADTGGRRGRGSASPAPPGAEADEPLKGTPPAAGRRGRAGGRQ